MTYMLTFVGLGLYDERSLTVQGQEAIRGADRVVAEFYTSRLVGASLADVEEFHGVEIEQLDRDDVEVAPEDLLADAADRDVAFLTGGDPLISTTHVDLRLRAVDRDVATEVIHAPSIATAAPGLAGLQNYRFGKATTIPFPGTFGDDGVPGSVFDTLDENLARELHTICYLDLDESGDRTLSASTAAAMLSPDLGDRLGVVVAGAGGPDPTVAADRIEDLADATFDATLHVLIVPGELHALEAEALRTLAGAPADLTPMPE